MSLLFQVGFGGAFFACQPVNKLLKNLSETEFKFHFIAIIVKKAPAFSLKRLLFIRSLLFICTCHSFRFKQKSRQLQIDGLPACSGG